MKVFGDYQGRAVRLTDERLAHNLEHPEMAVLEAALTDKPKKGEQLWPTK
jgi:hypothetical protein